MTALVAVVAACLVAAPAVSAQSESTNEIVSIDPADGATLDSSPQVLTFTFAEDLGNDDTLVAPVTCGNPPLPQSLGIPQVDDEDERIVTVEVLAPLSQGACTLAWTLRDGLGETITGGTVSFRVENAAQTTTPATTEPATPDTTTPASDTGGATGTEGGSDGVDDDPGSTGGAVWLGRLLSTLGILVVFGALVLIGAAWPEGPEYVVTVRFLRSMWILSVVGTLLFVIAYTADASGRSFGGSLSPGAWFDLADAGWPGRAALGRLVLVLATGWVVMRPERVIDPTTQMPAFLIPALAVVMVGLSRTGGPLAAIGVLMSIGHVLAVAVWLGGVALVARVVLAGPGDEDLVQAVRGFTRLSMPAILVVVVTGVVQVVRLVGGALFTSGHGQVMLLKTLAVAAMVFVAITARQMVAARLDRAHEMTAPSADRFRRAFSAEAAIGVVVLAFSAWMLSLTPERVDAANQVDYPVVESFVDPGSELEMRVLVTPAEVGPNGVRVEVETPEEGITNFVVSFVPPAGSTAPGVDLTVPLTGSGTAVLGVDQGLPLGAPGEWTMQISLATATGTVSGATNTFEVAAVDGGDDAEPTTATTGGVVETIIVGPGVTTAPTGG